MISDGRICPGPNTAGNFDSDTCGSVCHNPRAAEWSGWVTVEKWRLECFPEEGRKLQYLVSRYV